MSKVIVVTRPDLGWDRVVAVFSGLSMQEVRDRFPSTEYVHAQVEVETSLDRYLDNDLDNED